MAYAILHTALTWEFQSLSWAGEKGVLMDLNYNFTLELSSINNSFQLGWKEWLMSVPV